MKLNSLYTQHFINNQFVNSKSHQTFRTIDPSTEEVITVVQRGDALDVDEAVRSARVVFKTWRDVSGPHRRDLMLTLSDLMQENIQFLADVESRDNGQPVSAVKDNVSSAIKVLRYYAGWADKIQGRVIPLQNTDAIALTIHVSLFLYLALLSCITTILTQHFDSNHVLLGTSRCGRMYHPMEFSNWYDDLEDW